MPKTNAERGLAGLPIRDFPAELKTLITADADRQATTFNDAAVAVLAAHYRVKYQPARRRSSTPPGKSSNVNLDLPVALKKIATDAFRSERPQRLVALGILSGRYSAVPSA